MREGFKTIAFEGIGTHWWIDIPTVTDAKKTTEIEDSLQEILYDFDHKYSRFKEDSLVSELAKTNVINEFPAELFEMLTICERVKSLTDGHFDVCVGSYLDDLGYDAKYSFESKPQARKNAELKILELTKSTIRTTDNVIIDLGGIGKGWLIEKFRQKLETYNLEKFVINGGGDIYVKDSSEAKYKFALENPFDNSEMVGTIEIVNEAIACSSPSKRAWKDKQNGSVHHHLIDFTSGDSANKISAVFTQSKSIVNADLASTAIFVSDYSKAAAIAQELEAEYMVIFPDSSYFKSEGYKGVLN